MGIKRSLVDAVVADMRALAAEIDQMDQYAAERFGVNRTDLRGLELLSAAGALAPTALAGALGLTTGGVTTVIDRLEGAGYVVRRPDPRDRRRLRIEATELLTAREAEIFTQLLRATTELASSYTDAELTTIRDFLLRAQAVLRAQRSST